MKKLSCLLLVLFLCPSLFGQFFQKPKATDIKYKNAVQVSPGVYAGKSTLQQCLDALASSANDGSMGDATSTNRRAVLMTPGTYTLTTDLELPQYIDLIGMGGSAAVYLDFTVSKSLINTSVTESGNNISNVISGLTISSAQGYPISWSVGTGLCSLLISDCHIIALDNRAVNCLNTDKKIQIWSSIIDGSLGCLNISNKAGCTIDVFSSILRTSSTGSGGIGDDVVVGVYNLGTATSEINVYDCRMETTLDNSAYGSAYSATAYGVFLNGAGTISIYGGSLEVSALSAGNEAATAIGVYKGNLASGTINSFGSWVIDTSANAGSGTATEQDYSQHASATGQLKVYDVYGDFSKSANLTPVYPIKRAISCSATGVDMADYPNGSTFTNGGADAAEALAFTAPAAVVGAEWTVVDVIHTAGADVSITCAGSDTFIDPDDGSTTYTVYTHSVDKWGLIMAVCYETGKWQIVCALGATS